MIQLIRAFCVGLLVCSTQGLMAQGDSTRVDSLYQMRLSDLGVDSMTLHLGIDSIVNHAIDTGAFPGCQILLAKGGAVFFQKSYGHHSYDSAFEVGNSDLYDIASVTKVAGSTLALMKLHDEGKFDLDQTMGYYFPFLAKSDKKDLTMRKVLAHQSRLKNWIPYYKECQRQNGNYKRKTISKDSSLHYPNRIPGSALFLYEDFYEKKLKKMIKKSELYENEGYVYSGLAFYLFPELVERLSGLAFDDYLKENFYEPLGAETLMFEPLTEYGLDHIVPTEIDSFFRMAPLHGVVHDEGAAVMLGVSGNAGLFSTSYDLAKVLQMLMNGGVYQGRRYLSDSTIDEFTRCQYCDEDNRRGLGFDKPLIVYDEIKSSVAEKASMNSYGHSGYTGTLIWVDPDSEILFIFLSNRVYPTRENRLIYQLNVRPAIHTLVYDLLYDE